jgi:hypothetical protein
MSNADDPPDRDELFRWYWGLRGKEPPVCVTCGRPFVFPSGRPGECSDCDPAIDRTPVVLPACGGARGHVEWDETGARWVSDDTPTTGQSFHVRA